MLPKHLHMIRPKDLSDFISVDEMKTMFVELFGDWNEMSDQYVDQKMLEIDKDGDGKANFQEFCSVLKSCKSLLRLEMNLKWYKYVIKSKNPIFNQNFFYLNSMVDLG